MELYIILSIVYGIICGGFSAFVAGTKNRGEIMWFVLGGLFGIFALIAISGVPVQVFSSSASELSSDEIHHKYPMLRNIDK